MKPNGFTKGAKKLGGVISKNSPTILTGLAVGGLFTTVIFAVKVTPKAISIVEAHTSCNNDGEMEPPTTKEVIQLEKYFVGFDFSIAESPTLLVGQHDGKRVVAVNYINDSATVKELHEKLTNFNSRKKQGL